MSVFSASPLFLLFFFVFVYFFVYLFVLKRNLLENLWKLLQELILRKCYWFLTNDFPGDVSVTVIPLKECFWKRTNYWLLIAVLIALLKDLLFVNNILESENKALQKYSVTFKKVAEHGNSWSWAVKKQLNLMSDVWTPHIAHSVFLSDMFTLLQHLLFCTHPLLKFSLVLGHVPKAFKMYPYAESDLEPPQHQRQGFCDNS